MTQGSGLMDEHVDDFLKNLSGSWDRGEKASIKIFPNFMCPSVETEFYEAGIAAYEKLPNDKKQHAKKVVETALERCGDNFLGVVKTLRCLDLAHEINPQMGVGSVYPKLLSLSCESEEEGNRAELLRWTVDRFARWNVKIEATSEQWSDVLNHIAPQGIIPLLQYLKKNDYNSAQLDELCASAYARVEKESISLHNMDTGRFKKIIAEQIATPVSVVAGQHRESVKDNPFMRKRS
jgi:hypothetical protein